MGLEPACRVLLAGPDLRRIGGVATYVGLLSKHVNAARVRLTLRAVGRKPGRLWGQVWFRPSTWVLNLLAFAWEVFRTRPDLVHLNPSLKWRSLPESLGFLLVARLAGRPALVFFHGWDERIAQAMIRRRWNGRFLLSVLRLAQHYVVLAEGFRQQLVSAGLPAGQISLSSLPVEVSQASRALHGKHPGTEPFRVLWLSIMLDSKGVWEMLEAAEISRDAHPEARFEFVLAGTGSAHRSVQAHIRRRGLQELVRLCGEVVGEAKTQLFESADIFVFPSKYREGFPYVVVEALAAGLPLVFTQVPALAETLSAQNGVGISSADLSATVLAQCIWELYAAPDRRRAIARANRRLAAERFSVEIVCGQMESLYLKLAGK